MVEFYVKSRIYREIIDEMQRKSFQKLEELFILNRNYLERFLIKLFNYTKTKYISQSNTKQTEH